MLGELEYLTRVGPHLMSVTEEVRSWAAWLQPPIFLKRAWTFPATWMFRCTLGGLYAAGVGLPPCLACNFSGKLMSEGAKNTGSGSPRVGFSCLWPVLFMGLQAEQAARLHSPCLELSRLPASTLPVLKSLMCFEQGVLHFHFCAGSCKFCSSSWVPSEMLMRKETFLASLSFHPYQIHQQILLPCPPISWHLLLLSLLPPPPWSKLHPWTHEHGYVPRKLRLQN